MDTEPSTYGRNRQSIADLEQELYDIFQEHPQAVIGDNDEPVIPADSLVDILRTFSRNHDAVELMSKEEEDQLTQLIETNPGLAVTPTVLLQFIAMRTTVSPRHSPKDLPPLPVDESDHRGRSDFRDEEFEFEFEGHSRSSSRDSDGTSLYRSRPPSRGPSVSPSPFDTSRRQRTTLLGNDSTRPPSSWSRRPPPSRRKSDASTGRASSDSESSTSGFSRTPGRTRAPSNSTTPMSTSHRASPIDSPEYGESYSRPHSRTQSQPQASFSAFDSPSGDYKYGSSPEREQDLRTGLLSPPPSDQSESSFDEEQFLGRISSLQMPTGPGSDSDSDGEEDSTLGLVLDRSAASSTVSMEQQERLETLQRVNTDLARKLMEAERTLQIRLADHEQEIEDLQGRLDEVRSELSATKREEKELRSKDRQAFSQIAALESEVAKLQKSLDIARASYQSLQKQYQEQCSESERYRNELRLRDQSIKELNDAAALHALEAQKLAREQSNYEERIAFIEGELTIAQQAQAQLDEQKHENMMLKETIDRMRFDMDEMRNNASSAQGSGTASAHGSLSKSLGAELLSQLKSGEWDDEEPDEGNSGSTLGVESGDETEGEDVVQTIITRTKRKVASRAKTFETVKVEEVKEYSDSSTQYDTSEFALSSSTQTDPEPEILTVSLSVQTDGAPVLAMAIQTEAEPEPSVMVTTDVEIQTGDNDDNQSIFSTPHDEEEEGLASLASSSSTLVPPTPKPQSAQLHPHTHDLPPAYNQVTDQDQDELALRVANETLRKWHKGLKLPIEAVQGGISEDAVEDWKALKEELGVECTAIDRLVEESVRTSQPRSRDRQARRRSRFYNIYNTYVYGDRNRGGPLLSNGQFFLCCGAVFLAFCAGQIMAPSNTVPGGVTYYDRAAWSSFNTLHPSGEGFAGDTAAVWTIIGRFGGDAARNIRGWPT